MGVLGKIGNALLGNLGTAIIGGISSAYSQHQQNKNIDKQIKSQENEQKKNREYNLKLAQMQNQWNVEQWQRENDYNDPQAQIARLRAAGLNPDLIYGSGDISNVAAASPQMTSGAPSAPVDYSSLANKRTVGDAVMQSLAVEQAKANIDKTRGEAKAQGVTNDIRQRMIDKGMIIEEAEYDLLKENINKVFQEAESIDYTNTEARVMSNFFDKYESEIVDNMLQRLRTSTKMSENELKEDIETLALRIAGLNAENSELVRLSGFNTDEKRLVFDIVKELLRVFVTKKPPKLRGKR